MHARAHGIPTTPLTSDKSTALLSTLLTVKQESAAEVTSSCAMKIKQEPVEERSSVACLMESQEPMESSSIASSRNPSPGSIDMDDTDGMSET